MSEGWKDAYHKRCSDIRSDNTPIKAFWFKAGFEARNNEVDEKDTQISHWQKSAESKGRVIKRLGEQLDDVIKHQRERNDLILELEQQIKEKDARIAEFEKELINWGAAADIATILLGNLQAQSKQLAKAISDVLKTTPSSWWEEKHQETIELAKQILEGE